MLIDFEQPGPGQESVWDYPRPPQLETTSSRIVVKVGDVVIADTTNALRYLETSHPPSYFIPLADVRTQYLEEAGVVSPCEWRGDATYYHVVVDGEIADEAAVAYLDPVPAYAALKDHVAFFAGRVALATVDGVPALPQEGRYYCGWITPDVVGPFKGAPGTFNW